MKKLRTNYHRWLARNRDKGIPNLILFVMLGNVLVYLYCTFGSAAAVYNALCFDGAKILRGQIWRVFSFIFTYGFNYGGGLMEFVLLLFSAYCYWWMGKLVENVWGTLRLNLYFFGGVLFTGIVALLVYIFTKVNVYVTPYHLLLSLFLAVATLAPEQQVYVFFIIPVKLRWAALIDIGLTIYHVASNVVLYRPIWLSLIVFGTSAIVALLNYVLTFGRDVANLFPHRGYHRRRAARPFTSPAGAASAAVRSPNAPTATNAPSAAGRT